MSNKTKWIFGISGLGKDMMFAMSTIMSLYLINYVGMSAAFVGLMFMVVRLWDAINDPIMGAIVDNTKGKWGKFRPWILVGSILNAIVLIVLFMNPDLVTNSVQQYVFVTVLYTLWGMTYTLMDIPFWSMIPALSTDTKERVGITVFARVFTSIGFIIVSAGYIFFAQLLGGGDSIANKTDGLFIFAIIVSVIFIITQIVTVTNVKEKITDRFEGKVTLKDIFKSLIDNDQLLVVMIVVLVINFTLYITSGMAIYYITYDIGDVNLFGLFIMVGGVFQVLGSIVYPLLAKRFNRRKMFDFAIYAQFIGFIFLFLNAFVLGNNVVLLFVVGAFIFLGQGVFMVLQTILLADVVDYGELKLGRRTEGVVFSVQTFVVKLATGLSLGVIGIGLAVINFIEPIEESPEVFVEQLQTGSTLEGMRIMMFILPLFGLLISKWIFTKKHIIDEDYHAQIINELELKKGVALDE